jgi:hypothetical protein
LGKITMTRAGPRRAKTAGGQESAPDPGSFYRPAQTLQDLKTGLDHRAGFAARSSIEPHRSPRRQPISLSLTMMPD